MTVRAITLVACVLAVAPIARADDKRIDELVGVTPLGGSFATRESACSAAVKAQGGDLGDGNWSSVKDVTCEKFAGAKISNNKSAKKAFTDYAVFDFGKKWELGLVVQYEKQWFFANLSTLHEWRGKSCGGWSYKVDEVSDVVGWSGPAIAIKFSQSFACDAPGPRDGPDPGTFQWAETGVVFVGVGPSKKPSSTRAIIATSTQTHVLGKSRQKTAWLKTTIAPIKDGVKLTGTCAPYGPKGSCSEDTSHPDSAPRLGNHTVVFP